MMEARQGAVEPPLQAPARSGIPAPIEREVALAVSVVAPVKDERDNLRPLYERVAAAFPDSSTWELILVDDGSRDGSKEAIRALSQEDPRVRGVYLRRNLGQSAAIAAGARRARAEVVATLDADLQNDPADLPALIQALERCDAVVGVRAVRRDSWVRRASSRIANAVRNVVTGDKLSDTGCGLRVVRARAFRTVPIFNGMHRFLPTLLRMQGFTVLELPVGHHARTQGKSKYGLRNRAWRGLVDLFAVRWMKRRLIAVRELDEAEFDA